MVPTRTPFPRTTIGLSCATASVTLLLAGPLASSAHADSVVVPLATSSAFSVLAGSTVTNVGTTTISRSVGVSPGTAITGASTMTIGGTYHQADAVALQAKDALTTAYDNAAGQTPAGDQVVTDPGPELGGQTLTGGVYNRVAAMGLTGELTLDGGNGDNAPSDSVWVFQAGSTLTTASASSIVLTRGADACNVFWQVGSSATLGTATRFVGTVMADQSITMDTGATLVGRTFARVAAVNLHANVITTPGCAGDASVTDGTTTPVGTTPNPSDNPTTPSDGGNDGGNDGTGNTGGGDNGTGGTGGGSTGGSTQVTTPPSGSVDTGLVDSAASTRSTEWTAPVGSLLAIGFAGLALVAVRRRREV